MKELKLKINKIVAYAMNAVSFIMLDSTLFSLINAIYLFGSFVRKEATKSSDVDLFIDCEEKDEAKVEKLTKLALKKFYSSKDFEKWKLLGIDFSINIHVGKLEKWKELRQSIIAEGLLIYSKSFVKEGKRKVLIEVKMPKKKSKYLKIIRLLHGRKEYGIKGIIEKFNGKKIATNVFIIPQENLSEVLKILNKNKVNYELTEFFTYE